MATRTKVCNKFYVNDEGEQTNTAQDDSTGFGFHILSPTETDDKDKPLIEATHICQLADFSAVINTKAALMGFLQKIGDAYADKKRRDELGTDEIVQTMIERLKGNEWVVASAGVGPRPSMLLDAICNVLKTLHGVDELPDDTMDNVRASIADDDGKKSAMANPKVLAEYKKMQAEAAIKRANDAAKAADATAGAGDFLSNL